MDKQEELVTVDLCTHCGIVIGGELDVLTAPIVLDVVPEVSAVPGPINVDLSTVSFIDASGLRALLCLKHSLPATRVVALSPPVEKVLKITGTYNVLVDPDLSATG